MTDTIRRGKTTAFLDGGTPTEYRIDMTEAEVRERLDAARAANITDLLGTQITDLDTLTLMPAGAGVVDDYGDLHQRQADDRWYGAFGSNDNSDTSASLLRYSPTLLLAWLPPEVTGR